MVGRELEARGMVEGMGWVGDLVLSKVNFVLEAGGKMYISRYQTDFCLLGLPPVVLSLLCELWATLSWRGRSQDRQNTPTKARLGFVSSKTSFLETELERKAISM